MISTDQIRQNLYDLLAVKNFDVMTRDAKGKETGDAKEADLFTFDYKVGDTNYGTVVITITPEGTLEVFYGDRLGRSMEMNDKANWYDFLYQLRHFSRRNMMGFELKHMNKLKHAMKSMAAVTESKYYGYKNTSYTRPTKEAKLKIVHSKPIDEEQGDARYRNVAKLYVETAEGERFKLPFTKLYAGRAMARHCSEGGLPYDEFGAYISEMVDDIKVLEQFLRSARGKEWTDAGADLMVETGIRHLANLKKKVKKMIGRRGYREELDAFSPQQEQEHSETTDKIREMFTQTLLDTRIEQAIPVLNKLEARDSVMKEIQEFSSWADETTQLDLGEGFDPDSWEGEMEWEYAGDDGEPGYGGVRYTVVVDHEQNRAFVDPKSLQGWCHGDGNNKLTDEWCTQMVQPGGELHDEALQAAQEDVDAEWAERDVDVPAMEDKEYECPTCRGAGEYRDEEHKKHDCPDCDGEGKYVDVDDLEEGKMKGLALDMEELSDEEFEKKYQSKKSDWQEVKNKDLRMDPDQPTYIKKMKDVAGVLAAEGEEDEVEPFSSDDYDEYGVRQSTSFNTPPEKMKKKVSEGPTRKDFQMVADLLKANPDSDKRKELAKDYCDKFKAMNPRFDKERFMKACGLNEEDFDEGNEFTQALAQAKQQGKKEFEVGGKTYQVKESELDRIKHLSGL